MVSAQSSAVAIGPYESLRKSWWSCDVSTPCGEDTPTSSGRHRGARRRVGHWVAVLDLLYAVATLVVRLLHLTNNIALLVAVSARFAVVLAAVALVLSALGRRAVMSVSAVVVLAAALGIQIHW